MIVVMSVLLLIGQEDVSCGSVSYTLVRDSEREATGGFVNINFSCRSVVTTSGEQQKHR